MTTADGFESCNVGQARGGITREQIQTAFDQHVLSLPFLYKPYLYVYEIASEEFSLSVQVCIDSQYRGFRYADVNILRDTFYLLHIELPLSLRGEGYGSRLYQALENAAAMLSCRRLEQTPSGWTPGGEPRAAYLQRRGYTLEGGVAYKQLQSAPLR